MPHTHAHISAKVSQNSEIVLRVPQNLQFHPKHEDENVFNSDALFLMEEKTKYLSDFMHIYVSC